MEQLNSVVQNFDNTLNRWLSVVDRNEYVSAIVTLFLILYAGLAAPRLPMHIARLFEHPLFQLLIFFLIIYSAQRSPTVAIVAAIGLMVSLNTLTRHKMNNQLVQVLQQQSHRLMEGMTDGKESTLVEGDVVSQEELQENALTELVDHPVKCGKKVDFRNEFYPQYVNMKPDAYLARFSDGDVNGFDPNATYASI